MLERERYIQKSLRLATNGEIIKFGDAADIESQYKLFQDLADEGVSVVPRVILTSADDKSHLPAGTAWYRMPQYTSPSLADVLTRTDGLEDFEIERMVQAVVRSHTVALHGKISMSREFDLTAYLLTCALRSLYTATRVIKKLYDVSEAIQNERPVRVGRRIEVFAPNYFDQLSICKDIAGAIINAEGRLRIHAEPEPVDSLFGEKFGPSPLKQLQDIVDALQTTCAPIIGHTVKATHLHGDAHFGNCLIDASIPERPTIVLIDTKSITIESELDTMRPMLRYLKHDPLYDFSKLLMSGIGGHDLALREAITVLQCLPETNASDGRVRGYNVTIGYKDQNAVLRRLGDIGGHSDSQLVRFESAMPAVACRNYLVASRALGEEVSQWLSQYLRGDGPSELAAVVRLWLFTARHIFSSVDSLFPSQPQAAFTMLMLGTHFVNQGASHVLRAVRGDRAADVMVDDLKDAMRIGRHL